VPPEGPAHAAATAGFSITDGEIPRETDCLLEGAGFEPSVPRDNAIVNFAHIPDGTAQTFSPE